MGANASVELVLCAALGIGQARLDVENSDRGFQNSVGVYNNDNRDDDKL